MKRQTLADRLKTEGVPEDLYSLDGGQWGDRYCLEQRGSLWYVYHSERGQAYDDMPFVTEEEACDRLYDLLTSGRMGRYTSEPGAF